MGSASLGKSHIETIGDRLRLEPQLPQDWPKGYIVPGLGDAGDRRFGMG